MPSIFLAEQFTSTEFDSAEMKAKWANSMASWVKRGFSESGFTNTLYEHLRLHLYGHIAHYNKQGFYAKWFRDDSRRLDWLNYVVGGGALGSAGSPARTWSDVERAWRQMGPVQWPHSTIRETVCR